MEFRAVLLPDEDVVLAHGTEDGDILLLYHMPLAEPGILGHALDDLGQVMTEDLADGLFHPYLFHK